MNGLYFGLNPFEVREVSKLQEMSEGHLKLCLNPFEVREVSKQNPARVLPCLGLNPFEVREVSKLVDRTTMFGVECLNPFEVREVSKLGITSDSANAFVLIPLKSGKFLNIQ